MSVAWTCLCYKHQASSARPRKQVCNDSELFQPQHQEKAARCCSLFCCRTRSAHQRQPVTCQPSAKIWFPMSLTQVHTEPMEGDQSPGQETLQPHQLRCLCKQILLPEKTGTCHLLRNCLSACLQTHILSLLNASPQTQYTA